MFASLSRFRRLVAVLSALALMAGTLAAAPLAAADDPIADYTAIFSACEGVAGSGPTFEDVPAGHENAGDIDCIAYYGITKGTGDGTTYSPSMSVTREQMALFLTRLADVVGIEGASDPSDAGFTDIGDLSADSQTRINRLADLGITVGNNPSGTTYGPADAVTRGQMALFIYRLMNKMDPFADPNAADGDAAFAYIPEQVKDVPDDDGVPEKKVKSPFTDLKDVTKETYDAITALWELGVASGISATSYGPSSSIIRSAMADFMAGVLDHSNARPAGVTMQTNRSTDLGTTEAIIAVSYRDDKFRATVDASLKIFDTTETGVAPFTDDGKCADARSCEWSDSDTLTNEKGNVFIDPATVSTVADNAKGERTWYAWMGDDENTEFVMGSSGEASVTLTAMPDALDIDVTANISDKVGDDKFVAIAEDKAVVITAQLVDADGGDDPVAKPGVDLRIITYSQNTVDVFPLPAAMKTDENGQVKFTITSPDPDGDETAGNNTSDYILTFTGDVDKGSVADVATGTITIKWTDADANPTLAEVNVPPYAVIDSGKVSVRVTVSHFDQFGNPDGQGGSVGVTLTSSKTGEGNTDSSTSQTINSQGVASFRGSVIADPGSTITPTFTGGPSQSGGSTLTATTTETTTAVRHADKNDDNTAAGTVEVYADDNAFRFTADGHEHLGILYSYDSDDTFISSGGTVDMNKFEELIQPDEATIQVLTYTVDGSSIFIVG